MARGRRALVGALCLAAIASAASCGNPATQPAAQTLSATTPAPPTVITPVASSATFDLLSWPGSPSGPYPIKDCSDAGGVIGASDPVAVVAPHGKEVALRDYADAANPRTLCRFSFPGILQLIDSRHIVVANAGTCNVFAVVDIPAMVHHYFEVPVSSCDFSLIGVSPGLDQVAWAENLPNGKGAIHVYTQQGDHMSTALSGLAYERGAFSPSGQYLFVLASRSAGVGPDTRQRVLLVMQGAKVLLRLTPPTGGWPAGAEPSMPLWSPTSDTLYYSHKGAAWTWTPGGGSRTLLSSTTWCFPTISSDGRYLAYAALSASGASFSVYVVDLSSSTTAHLVSQGVRNEPVFLGARFLWYQTWVGTKCAADSGQPKIYDTHDGSESPSSIDQTYNVWPATSTNPPTVAFAW